MLAGSTEWQPGQKNRSLAVSGVPHCQQLRSCRCSAGCCCAPSACAGCAVCCNLLLLEMPRGVPQPRQPTAAAAAAGADVPPTAEAARLLPGGRSHAALLLHAAGSQVDTASAL